MPVIVRRSKRYKKAAEKATPTPVSIDQAIDVVKSFPAAKFDQSVELIFNLGIDPKQADQMIRSSLSLPHGVGKSKRVVAFCPEHLVANATAAARIPAGGPRARAGDREREFHRFRRGHRHAGHDAVRRSAR